MSEVVIRLQMLTAGLNGSDGLMRSHFGKAGKVKKSIVLEVLSQRPAGHKAMGGPLRVEYTRYCHAYMDWDNACASFKHVGDALVKAGIITDDNPAVISEFVPKQVKIKMKEPVYTEVKITKI